MAGQKKGAYQQSARVLAMIEELRGRHMGMTLQELADHFEISTKQVQRDLACIEAEGHELDRNKGDSGRMRFVLRDAPLKSVELTLRERYALLAVRRMFDVLANTPLYDDVRSVYAKIARGFAPELRAELERMQDCFVF